MAFTRQDYERLANILADPEVRTKGQIVNRLTDMLAEDNLRFNYDRFVKTIAKRYAENVKVMKRLRA